MGMPSATGSYPRALEAVHERVNALKTLARLLQADAAELRLRVDEAEREAWDQKARRADVTAKLSGREKLLEQIQRSAVWKTVKPIWKLFHRSSRQARPAEKSRDFAFTVDLPKRWTTNRDVLLVKGWCFSRSGRQIAGIRAKIGKKARLARYGLKRFDVAASFPEHPTARQSGFTLELKVPPGNSSVQLEAIEHGSDWQPFFSVELKRATTPGLDELDEAADRSPEPVETILKLPALSASKAFALIQPGFRDHASRVASETPVFSLLTPSHNTKPEWLTEAAVSILNQTFLNWEWCIADDGSGNSETRQLLESLSTLSPRLKVSASPGTGISAATNHALEQARGQYVCFLDHDDLLHPLALESIHEKLGHGYDMVYSDEDKLDDATGRLVEPFFKPAWSPEYFRGVMYVGHLLCVKRDLALKTGFDSSYDGVQDYEFMLRLSETNPRIGHVPRILYHWRKTPGSIAESPGAKPKIGLLQERAVNAHLERLRLPARAEQAPLPHRLKFIPGKSAASSRVTIIIPSKNAPDVLDRCLKSLFKQTSYPTFEVIVMDNNTTDERALQLMRDYPVRRIHFPDPFNFSRANNLGAAEAESELVVFLNNDTEVVTADWLQHLAYYAEQPDVGAAGALLAYKDRTVQHAGVVLGMRGTADHLMRKFPVDVDGYAGSLACAREVTAVTGACLMIRKALFTEVGGFNPHFFTAYQDLDLCLRLRARGLRIVCTPQALLLHHEYTSRRSYYDMVDRTLLLDQWEDVIDRGDPYYNRNLDLHRGDYSRCSA
ncbi:MAG: glycosyltransferase family 2 protein [Verrucomicrobiota bacterium]|nr:glycosyltransferase family 2 protein [Verrucomicrobiota bacterium]